MSTASKYHGINAFIIKWSKLMAHGIKIYYDTDLGGLNFRN